MDWCEVWTIAVIFIMLMENSSTNSAVYNWEEEQRTQVTKQRVDTRKDAGKAIQKSVNYV